MQDNRKFIADYRHNIAIRYYRYRKLLKIMVIAKLKAAIIIIASY